MVANTLAMRRLSLLFVSLAFLLAFHVGAVVAVAQDPSGIEKRAFLVGVAGYEKDGLPDLNYAENDMRVLGEELQKLGFKVTVVLGKDATRKNVSDSLDQYLKELGELSKTDVALFAFSGHGLQRQVEIDGRLTEDAFFCPVDANKEDPSSLVSIGRLMDDIQQKSGSSQNLVLVDACRNNPAKGAKGMDGSTARNLGNKISVLYSSTGGMRSFEAVKVKHGLFTYILLEGLRGDAASRNGDVTWLNLASYVMDAVPARAAELLDDPACEQRPNLIGNLVRQPVLARFEAKTSPARKVTPILPDAPERSAGGSSSEGWNIFTSSGGNFSVRFPGEPTTSQSPLPNNPNALIHQFVYTRPDDKSTFLIAYNTISTTALTPEQEARVLEASPQGMLNAMKMDGVSQKRQMIGEFTGREIGGESKPGEPKTMMTARYAVAGGRLYQIVAIHADQPDFEAIHATEAKKFFDSFNFTDAFEELPSLAQIEWKVSSSGPGRFEALFPGETIYKKSNIPYGNGGNALQHQFMANAANDSYSFQVSYTEYPVANIPTSQHGAILDGAQRAVLKMDGFELIQQRSASFGSRKGRELRVRVNGGYGTFRYVLVGNRLYQMVVVHIGGPDIEAIHAETREKFFNSFKFVSGNRTSSGSRKIGS